MRFGKKGKLALRFVGAFRILQRVRKLAYRLDLSPSLSNAHPVFHVSMMRAYEPNLSHVIEYSDLIVEEDVSYAMILEAIVDQQEKVLRGKMIPLLRVIWKYGGVEEQTWEREANI